MSNAELSIQLQADSIAAVKAAMVVAVADRPDNTLWWLTDYSHDIVYQNRITGSELIAIDRKVNSADVSSVFSSWFGMQNSYFSSDKPIPNVTTLKQAIETFYRWRVANHFNEIMGGASSGGVVPQYVFPDADYVLGTYEALTSTTGTFTLGSGAVDSTKVGPGVLALKPMVQIGSSDLVLTITAVRQDQSTIPIVVTVPLNSDVDEPVIIGEQALTAAYTASSGNGVVHLANTNMFKAGQWVLLREDLTSPPDFPSYWKTEIAEVVSVDSATQLTLRQPTLTGSSTPFSAGLRNDFSTSAFVYPLFVNATAANNSNTSGNVDDVVSIGFDPDRPQEFLDITDISYPQ